MASLQINYSNKNALSAAMIVAGWDAEGGGQARTTLPLQPMQQEAPCLHAAQPLSSAALLCPHAQHRMPSA